MQISVFGVGYLGAVHAACMASLGHEVGGVDVGKSTVPVGTAEEVAERVEESEPEAELVWNPEFLREGHAVEDTLHPDRFVYGVADGSEDHPAVAVLDAVYSAPLAS